MVARKSLKRFYAIPAIETEEGKNRVREYHEALGRFIDMFSRAEIAVQYVLRFYAKAPANRAQILFNGTRADAGMDLIKALAKAEEATPEEMAELTVFFAQLKAINRTRNGLLHWGAKSVAEGEAFVFTGLEGVKVDAKGVRHFPISVAILNQMTADLRKISLLLAWAYMGRPKPRAQILHDGIERELKQPWLYKPPQPPH